MALVLAALSEMRTIETKQDVITYIERQGWFDIHPEDLRPQNNYEPRWHTLIAAGRFHGVASGWMMPHDQNDHWEISREGHDVLAKLRLRFSSGEYDVRNGYLWSPRFKKWLCPTYAPSDRDWPRPSDQIYYV